MSKNRKHNKRAGFVLLLVLASFIGSCADTDIKPTGQAIEEIIVAIAYKRSECGNMPNFVLIPPAKPPVYGTDACSMAIIASTCPFNQYPAECLSMYGAKFKGYGP